MAFTTTRTRLDLSYGKKEKLAVIIQQEFSSVINSNEGYIKIYTDYSKIEYGVGSSIYTNGEADTWKLPDMPIVYMAELIAAQQVLQHVLKRVFEQCLLKK